MGEQREVLGLHHKHACVIVCMLNIKQTWWQR